VVPPHEFETSKSKKNGAKHASRHSQRQPYAT
jgi:hypothetical protein